MKHSGRTVRTIAAAVCLVFCLWLLFVLLLTGSQLKSDQLALSTIIIFKARSAMRLVGLKSYVPDDPGSGSVMVTSIDGAGPGAPPIITCTATPNTLWPPDGRTVTVQVSGRVSKGPWGLDRESVSYNVIDPYGEIQPFGSVGLAADGSYSFTVSLVAARNTNRQDGRRLYLIDVTAKDPKGNLGGGACDVEVPGNKPKAPGVSSNATR
jgi:hypothetical protein